MVCVLIAADTVSNKMGRTHRFQDSWGKIRSPLSTRPNKIEDSKKSYNRKNYKNIDEDDWEEPIVKDEKKDEK